MHYTEYHKVRNTTTTVTMNTCSFSYVPLLTRIPRRAKGIERTWNYIQTQLGRQGAGLPYSTARYFETIGHGPVIFAVYDLYVYYENQHEWVKYRSAYDIVFDTIDIPD
jgi:hypothetical protein